MSKPRKDVSLREIEAMLVGVRFITLREAIDAIDGGRPLVHPKTLEKWRNRE